MAATKKRSTAVTPTKKSEDEILANAMARVQNETGGDADEAEEQTQAAVAASKTAASKKKPATAQPELPRSKKKPALIAYTPLEEGDPVFTIFFGMKFTANVGREVTNEEAINLARNNPWFTVDGKHHTKRKAAQPRDEDDLAARSGLPDGLDPEKAEVEATAEDFVE